MFGAYPYGSVIPDYIARESGSLDEYVKDGFLVPCADAVNVELVPVVKQSNPGDTAGMMARLITAEAEANAQEQTAKHQFARAEELGRKLQALQNELALKVTEIDRLKGLIGESESKIKVLESELAAAQQLLAEKPVPEPAK